MGFLRLLLQVFMAGSVFFRELNKSLRSFKTLKGNINILNLTLRDIVNHNQQTKEGMPMSVIADQLAIANGTYDPELEEMLLNNQREIEQLFHKNQLMPRLTEFYRESKVPFAKAMAQHDIPEAFGFACLVQMSLHKRATVETMVGVLRYLCKGNCQATANLLEKCVLARLVDWDRQLQKFIIINAWDIPKQLQNELDAYQHPLPMIVPPRPVRSNQDTGYLTMTDSIILRNYHTDDVVLDHINRVNAIPLTLNHEVARMVKNRWRHLDKPKKGEEREEYLARVKAFNKYDRTSKEVFMHLAMSDGPFYLTHRYDKRGRTYCVGYHVTYQGNGWNKAMVNFYNQEVCNDQIME
jgi:hypothetical protein